MAATIFRATGFDTEGDLELSAAHLYAGAERADLEATITSSHAPIVGAVSTLANGDLNAVCRFAAQDVKTPGFYIQWTLPAAVEVSRIRLGAGGDSSADTRQITLSALHGRTPRTWGVLQTTARMSWYAEEPARLVARTPFVPETILPFSTTASCALPIGCLPGDYLIAFVLHRSALTTPPGWSLLRTAGPVDDGAGTMQWQSLLSKVASSDDYEGALTVTQASAGRLVLGVAAMNTKGSPVVADVASDAASGVQNQYVDAIPTTVPIGGIAVASATMIAIAVSAGDQAWTYEPPPPQTTPLFGGVLQGSDKRLVAAISAANEMFAPRFVVPISTVGTTGVTKITVTVTPAAGSTVLKEGPFEVQTRGVTTLTLPGEALTPQGLGRTQKLSASERLLDAEFGGQCRIYGTVSRNETPTNAPLIRRVRLHRSRDGALVRETWSKADGSYEFTEISGRYEYDVIAWDHEMQFRSVVANNLVPEVMP